MTAWPSLATEESYELRNCIYFAQEIALMLDDAGFSDVVIEGDHTGQPATPDDGTVIFVARKAHGAADLRCARDR